jgi:BolA protein
VIARRFARDRTVASRAAPADEGIDMGIARAIRQRLTKALEPSRLELVDQSALHVGHAGSRPEGETHFQLTIVAPAFEGRSRIERQRMVFGALGDLMQTDIHALSITALTPVEAAAMPKLGIPE